MVVVVSIIGGSVVVSAVPLMLEVEGLAKRREMCVPPAMLCVRNAVSKLDFLSPFNISELPEQLVFM